MCKDGQPSFMTYPAADIIACARYGQDSWPFPLGNHDRSARIHSNLRLLPLMTALLHIATDMAVPGSILHDADRPNSCHFSNPCNAYLAACCLDGLREHEISMSAAGFETN